MKSKWKVTSNPINGETRYGVYRLRNIDEVDHSGNREMVGGYTIYKEAAQNIADILNEEVEAAK